MKYFLISIDTEGDNLWNWHEGQPITTENANYVPRFQNICEKYGFVPTYLLNYEMVQNKAFTKFLKSKVASKSCEIGMHLHAWNTPPYYSLKRGNSQHQGLPYLIEYPNDVMESKIDSMTSILKNVFDENIVTHRAGRWATNNEYYDILCAKGYKYDCSVTPLINWNGALGYTDNSCGSDYSDYSDRPYIINQTKMIEIPMTIKKDHRLIHDNTKSIKRKIKLIKRAVCGYGALWLRPDGSNLNDLMYLVNKQVYNDEYIMFMLHSSELMPGGSPTFKTEESIEKLYSDLEVLFKHISSKYTGCSIGAYGDMVRARIINI